MAETLWWNLINRHYNFGTVSAHVHTHVQSPWLVPLLPLLISAPLPQPARQHQLSFAAQMLMMQRLPPCFQSQQPPQQPCLQILHAWQHLNILTFFLKVLHFYVWVHLGTKDEER